MGWPLALSCLVCFIALTDSFNRKWTVLIDNASKATTLKHEYSQLMNQSCFYNISHPDTILPGKRGVVSLRTDLDDKTCKSSAYAIVWKPHGHHPAFEVVILDGYINNIRRCIAEVQYMMYDTGKKPVKLELRCASYIKFKVSFDEGKGISIG